jgi:alkyldihydroxyacetonephosphate synthase
LSKTLQEFWILDELKDIVGPENVSVEDSDKDIYSIDVSLPTRTWADRGGLRPRPDFIVFPGCTEEVSEVVQLANRYDIPIIPRGAGAGSMGGSVAFTGGIIIDMKRMNKVVRLDEFSYNVTAQTGIMQIHLEDWLNDRGYTTKHYPASIYCSSLGGFLACRGSGHFSSKYGKIEDLVLNMEVVLPDGTIINTLPVPNHSAGPSLEKWFLGSEGIFGIITQCTLKIKKLPEAYRFKAVMFDSLHDALETARKIMISGLKPAVIRIYDEGDTQQIIKNVLGEDVEAGGYMIIGFDGFKEVVEAEENVAKKIWEEQNGRDLGADPGYNWWKNRFNSYFPPYTLESTRELYCVVDSCALHENVEKIYNAMKSLIETKFAQYDVKFIAHFSHWYDWGGSIYPHYIVGKKPQDRDEFMRLNNEIWCAATSACIDNGGLLNEHHGLGVQLSRLMKKQYGPAIKVLEKLKLGLDPNFIMNPGKLGVKGK